VLRGLERFRILSENDERSYRRAVIEPLHERTLAADDRSAVRRCREKLETMLSPAVLGDPRDPRASGKARTSDARIPTAMSDEDLINALAQYLDLEPLEKQALLEQPSLITRGTSLVELLEMKIMVARTPGVSTVTH
jgi:Lon protease-like protein